MLFFDFEVFYADWMLVVLDSTDHSKHVFINQNDEFIQFYQDHKNDVWTGFNSRHYDQYIAKAIIAGFAPQMMNAWIINQGKGGWEFSSEVNRIQFYTFDLMTVRGQSLKQLEGFMGDSVEETKVDFTIQRKLTDAEIDEVIEYCTHDVEETVNVFIKRKEEWDSQMGLIKEFNLPLRMVGKTKAQLAAVILGAHKPAKDRDDEMDISFPSTMQVSKYKDVVDFYRTTRDYEQSFIRNVAGVKHIFAWGGLHGARENYHAKGTIINVDVGSYYPSIMIRYEYMSRNIKDKAKFVEIYKQRLEYKAKHDPRQAPRKIVLNSTYGATKDKYNDLYDPRQANNVCVGGMMLLLDLIEKLEPYVELIQSNTDGLYVRLLDDSYFSKVDDICWEWEQRTGMSLEFNQYDEIYQKDVNNYIIIDRVNNHVKTKGAYVKGLHDLDYDLPIVNKAVVDYFVHGTRPQKTVWDCDDLRQFQRVVKLSYKYDGAAVGGQMIPGKVFRVFADKSESAPRLNKIKNGSLEKISYTPNHVFIVNGDVNGKSLPDKLDRMWYVRLAKSRIKNFLGEE
jgi:hypothetical protein